MEEDFESNTNNGGSQTDNKAEGKGNNNSRSRVVTLNDTIFHNIYLKSKFMQQIYKTEEFENISEEKLKFFLQKESYKGNVNLLGDIQNLKSKNTLKTFRSFNMAEEMMTKSDWNYQSSTQSK